MTKAMLTGRRRWVIGAAAAVLVVGGATAATAAVASDSGSSPTGTTAETDSTNAAHDDGSDPGGAEEPATTPDVSAAEAADTALADLDNAILDSVELTGPADSAAWNVELITTDYNEHELRVDAGSGEILSRESDEDSEADDWTELKAIDDATSVTLDAATQAALTELGEDATVTEVERDGTGDAPLWEVEVTTGDGIEHQVMVNAADGSVSSHTTDQPSADDDDDSDDDD
ncbi:MAG: PepSY domain-containing protein [Stackebrandtia sp.]